MAYQAIEFPTFQPSMRIITAITNAFPAEITTSFPHQYLDGTIIRLHIPIVYGMQQANNLFGTIEVTGSATFNIAIDTSLFDIFSVPSTPPPLKQFAQAIAIGEVPETLLAAEQNVLPY